jgi:hypothetical protein
MLNVPIFYQPGNTEYCGPACVKMVFAYHGMRLSLKSIANALPMLSNGIDIASLGTFFLDYGFDVSIKLWLQKWPTSFLWGDNFERQLRQWCERNVVKPNKDRKIYRRSLPKFLEKGGQVIPSPVSLEDIKKSLEPDPNTGKASPCILNINVSNLYGWRRRIKNAAHYVVPVYMDNESIGINDPNKKYGGRFRLYPISTLMHASYSLRSAVILPKRRV